MLLGDTPSQNLFKFYNGLWVLGLSPPWPVPNGSYGRNNPRPDWAPCRALAVAPGLLLERFRIWLRVFFGGRRRMIGWFFSAPYEAPMVRRGDPLGLRLAAARYAEALAPGLSNRTLDARWLTICAWMLVRAASRSSSAAVVARPILP